MKSLSRVRLCATPWTAAYRGPLPMGFSRQEYWSGLPLPSPFISLGRFNHRYFIFDAVINGIVFLISLSDHSLLVYKNAGDFCVLILYPATLQNLLRSSHVLIASLRSSMYSIMSCENSDSFISFYI